MPGPCAMYQPSARAYRLKLAKQASGDDSISENLEGDRIMTCHMIGLSCTDASTCSGWRYVSACGTTPPWLLPGSTAHTRPCPLCPFTRPDLWVEITTGNRFSRIWLAHMLAYVPCDLALTLLDRTLSVCTDLGVEGDCGIGTIRGVGHLIFSRRKSEKYMTCKCSIIKLCVNRTVESE